MDIYNTLLKDIFAKFKIDYIEDKAMNEYIIYEDKKYIMDIPFCYSSKSFGHCVGIIVQYINSLEVRKK